MVLGTTNVAYFWWVWMISPNGHSLDEWYLKGPIELLLICASL